MLRGPQLQPCATHTLRPILALSLSAASTVAWRKYLELGEGQMSQRWMLLSFTILACSFASTPAFAHIGHERPYEFDGTHVALSIERFMGIDYTDFEGPGGDKATARFLLNASEPVPTSLARFGLDVFIGRLSLGLAGGFTSADVGIIAPRIGYLFGLTPTLGLWLRAGGFYAAAGVKYTGITGEVLLGWFPYSNIALHLGPTIDVAFANEPNRDYISLGIPEVGMTVFL
jgi:hypothetical protein